MSHPRKIVVLYSKRGALKTFLSTLAKMDCAPLPDFLPIHYKPSGTSRTPLSFTRDDYIGKSDHDLGFCYRLRRVARDVNFVRIGRCIKSFGAAGCMTDALRRLVSVYCEFVEEMIDDVRSWRFIDRDDTRGLKRFLRSLLRVKGRRARRLVSQKLCDAQIFSRSRTPFASEKRPIRLHR
jgi:hypothetical protein